MSLEATSDLWWKNAIVYCVDTQAFLDRTATASATSTG